RGRVQSRLVLFRLSLPVVWRGANCIRSPAPSIRQAARDAYPPLLTPEFAWTGGLPEKEQGKLVGRLFDEPSLVIRAHTPPRPRPGWCRLYAISGSRCASDPSGLSLKRRDRGTDRDSM